MLLSIKASGAGLNLHWNCSDIIIACVAENINMVLQALGRTHRIGQVRFQRVWIITQDHSYDQLLQAAQTKKMLQQIAGEGLIELDDNDFEINDDQIADETADIVDDDEKWQKADELRGEALLRKGHAIRVQSEEIIARMMGQRCSRLDWACQKDLKLKDKVEQVQATPAKVRTALLPGVQPVPLSLGRSRELHATKTRVAEDSDENSGKGSSEGDNEGNDGSHHDSSHEGNGQSSDEGNDEGEGKGEGKGKGRVNGKGKGKGKGRAPALSNERVGLEEDAEVDALVNAGVAGVGGGSDSDSELSEVPSDI